MLIKLVLRNFEYEGVTRIFVSISSHSLVKDLKEYIRNNLRIERDFQIFVHDYLLTDDQCLRDYICLAEDGQNLKAHVIVKPEVSNKVLKNNDGSITKLVEELDGLKQMIEELASMKPNIQETQKKTSLVSKRLPNQIEQESSSSEEIVRKIVPKQQVQNKAVESKPKEAKQQLKKQEWTQQNFKAEARDQAEIPLTKEKAPSKPNTFNQKQTKVQQPIKKQVIDVSSSSESLDSQLFRTTAKQKSVPFIPVLQKPLTNGSKQNQTQNHGETRLAFFKINSDQIKDDPNTLQKGDRIKFKHVYLDLETVQPTVSNYCYGKIINNYHDQMKVQIHKEQSNDSIVLSYSELVEVWKEGVNTGDEENSKNNDDQNQSTQPLKQYLPRPSSQKQSRFLNVHMDMLYSVGRQINYYYCEKAYAKDDYIKSHLDDENCMPLVHLLNFPKIKKVLNSEQKLVELLQLYLEQEGANANYEIFKKNEIWVVRKK